MRVILALSFVAVLLSGCSSDTPEDSDPTPVVTPMGMLVAENATFSGDVAAGVEPFVPLVGGVFGYCQSPISVCPQHQFTITADGNVTNMTMQTTLTLTWGIDQNDFDIIVLDSSGNEVGANYDIPPATSAVVDIPLTAGTYTVVIGTWQVVADSYTLDVAFSLNVPEVESEDEA